MVRNVKGRLRNRTGAAAAQPSLQPSFGQVLMERVEIHGYLTGRFLIKGCAPIKYTQNVCSLDILIKLPVNSAYSTVFAIITATRMIHRIGAQPLVRNHLIRYPWARLFEGQGDGEAIYERTVQKNYIMGI